jgi:hypothetical protein
MDRAFLFRTAAAQNTISPFERRRRGQDSGTSKGKRARVDVDLTNSPPADNGKGKAKEIVPGRSELPKLDLEEDLSCTICYELMAGPVSLSMSSLCRSCVGHCD